MEAGPWNCLPSVSFTSKWIQLVVILNSMWWDVTLRPYPHTQWPDSKTFPQNAKGWKCACKKSAYRCVSLPRRGLPYLFTSGSEVNSAIKASFHLFPAETRPVCVCLFVHFYPCSHPFSVRGIRDCVWGVCDCLDVCVCMCVPPSGDICPLAHRNPLIKGQRMFEVSGSSKHVADFWSEATCL